MKRKGEGRRREGEKEERGDEPPLHVLDSLLHYTNNLRQAINRLPPSDYPHVMVLVVPDRLTSWLWWCLTESPHPAALIEPPSQPFLHTHPYQSEPKSPKH